MVGMERRFLEKQNIASRERKVALPKRGAFENRKQQGKREEANTNGINRRGFLKWAAAAGTIFAADAVMYELASETREFQETMSFFQKLLKFFNDRTGKVSQTEKIFPKRTIRRNRKWTMRRMTRRIWK